MAPVPAFATGAAVRLFSGAAESNRLCRVTRKSARSPARCTVPPPRPPPSAAGDGDPPLGKDELGAVRGGGGPFNRRHTIPVKVGDVWIGGKNPVVVQSMINEDTMQIHKAVKSIREMHEAGCEIVRVTCISGAHAHAVGMIKKELRETYKDVPLVADVHHNGLKIALLVAQHVDKVRINPGLFVFEAPDPNREEYTPEEFAQAQEELKEKLSPLILLLKKQGKAMRIGVNHGSLAERMVFTYGDSPRGMVESALEVIRVCRDLDFHNLIISMKASNVRVMLAAYRELGKTLDELGFPYPIHLGVTEAGDGEYGRIKSTLGIGTLLEEGIGDTIRVSLTEAPIKEIPVCYGILQGLGIRRTMVEYVACPSCGRTLFNLEEVLHKVREATKHISTLSIAVMGCIVNGPGEMADADYGYVGKTPGRISLYRGKTEIKTVPEADGVKELIALLKEDGVWIEPPEEKMKDEEAK